MLPGHARARGKDELLLTADSTAVQPSGALQGLRPRVVSTGSRNDDVSLVSPPHPLHRRSPSVTLTNHATGGETRPRLTRILDHSSQDPEGEGSTALDNTTHTESASGEATTVVHKVDSTDSLPGVALRYGISVAALRRANNLWPSDPIYLRTELKIPRANPTPVRRKLASVEGVDLPVPEHPSRSSSDGYASTLPATVGDAILSIFSARASLDSLLSSRASSSEVLELDDLAAMRASKSASGARRAPSITRDGIELSILGDQSRAPATTTLPPLPCVETSNALSASENATLHRRVARRIDPTVFIPVRISQLEPEPAMELPTRRRG